MSDRPMMGKSIREQVDALGGPGRGGGTRKLAEARAAASGKSVAAELRAVQRALKSGTPPAKQAPEVAQAGAASAAAEQLRGARRVKAGNVKVTYQTRGGRRSEGERSIGDLDVTPELRDALNAAAEAYEAGDHERGDELLNEAILDAYGDLGGTLEIDDFINGLGFE